MCNDIKILSCKLNIEENNIYILFSNNKIGVYNLSNIIFKNSPYYRLKNKYILQFIDNDFERIYWGNCDTPIIDIHINQILPRVRFLNEQEK